MKKTLAAASTRKTRFDQADQQGLASPGLWM